MNEKSTLKPAVTDQSAPACPSDNSASATTSIENTAPSQPESMMPTTQSSTISLAPAQSTEGERHPAPASEQRDLAATRDGHSAQSDRAETSRHIPGVCI
jgi:hypothetical protein